MCTAFWHLDIADFACPKCGARSKWNMQTHFKGQAGSCVLHYGLGEPVEDLEGVKADFRFGATIRNGAVQDVFPLEEGT